MSFRVASYTLHHTPLQIERAVIAALDIADQLELIGEDRAVLLPGILNLTSAVHIQLEQVGVGLALGDGINHSGRVL